jgi:hypothetical protein
MKSTFNIVCKIFNFNKDVLARFPLLWSKADLSAYQNYIRTEKHILQSFDTKLLHNHLAVPRDHKNWRTDRHELPNYAFVLRTS